jgi:hypothetical protein
VAQTGGASSSSASTSETDWKSFFISAVVRIVAEVGLFVNQAFGHKSGASWA